MFSYRWADKQQGDTPSISFFLEGLSSQFKVLGVYIASIMIKSKFTLRIFFYGLSPSSSGAVTSTVSPAARRASINSAPQSDISPKMRRRLWPRSLRLYSTRGGTSLYTVRVIMPASSIREVGG